MIANSPKNSAVFMGRSTIDNTYLLDSFPEENTKVFAKEYLCQYGGPALNAAITNNEKEINVIEKGDKTKIPVPEINAVDTLGAGDVLHGAFCYYLTEGLTRKEALNSASLIASRSCCYFGTHIWRDHE